MEEEELNTNDFAQPTNFGDVNNISSNIQETSFMLTLIVEGIASGGGKTAVTALNKALVKPVTKLYTTVRNLPARKDTIAKIKSMPTFTTAKQARALKKESRAAGASRQEARKFISESRTERKNAIKKGLEEAEQSNKKDIINQLTGALGVGFVASQALINPFEAARAVTSEITGENARKKEEELDNLSEYLTTLDDIDIAIETGMPELVFDKQKEFFNWNTLDTGIGTTLTPTNATAAANNIVMIQKAARAALDNAIKQDPSYKYIPANASEVIWSDSFAKYIDDKYQGDFTGTYSRWSGNAFSGGIAADVKKYQESVFNEISIPLIDEESPDSGGWVIDGQTVYNEREQWMSKNPEYNNVNYWELNDDEKANVNAEFKADTSWQSKYQTAETKLSKEQYDAAPVIERWDKFVGSNNMDIESPADIYVEGNSIRNSKTGKEIARTDSEIGQTLLTYTEAETVKLIDTFKDPAKAAEADAKADAAVTEAENQWIEQIEIYNYNNGIKQTPEEIKLIAKEKAASGFSAEAVSSWKSSVSKDGLIGQYRQWESAIKGGADIRGLAKGWLDTLSVVYGIDSTQVDLNDPLLQPAITPDVNGKTMSPAEYASWLRKQDTYFGTEEAANKYSQLAQLLDSKFGI